MTWKPQPESGVAVYKQICDYFERQIIEGKLLPGDRLPAERELAERLDVNRATVSAAYGELRAMALVDSAQGRGTRVSESMWASPFKRSPNWRQYAGGRAFDPTAALQRRLLEAASVPGTVNLTRGELSPDLMPLQQLQHLTAGLDWLQPYTYHADTRGDLPMREALAAFLYERHAMTVRPNGLIITAGVIHALHLIASTLLEPGDAVAVEGPSYLYATRVFTAAGLRMFKLPVDEQGLDPGALPELIRKHRIRMVFANPTYQNPTGTTLSLARRQELLAICGEHRIPIVEDDPYSLLPLENGAAVPPLRSLPGGEEFVFYLGTLSKTVSPGMRTGWIAAPAPAIARLLEAKRRMGYSSSHAGERTARLLLSGLDWDSHLLRVRERLAARRSCMLQALDAHIPRSAAVLLPARAKAGGFYIWMKLGKPVPDGRLADALLRERVLVQPGSLFGAGPGYIRLTYASVGEPDIIEGVRRLGAALRSL